MRPIREFTRRRYRPFAAENCSPAVVGAGRHYGRRLDLRLPDLTSPPAGAVGGWVAQATPVYNFMVRALAVPTRTRYQTA